MVYRLPRRRRNQTGPGPKAYGTRRLPPLPDRSPGNGPDTDNPMLITRARKRYIQVVRSGKPDRCPRNYIGSLGERAHRKQCRQNGQKEAHHLSPPSLLPKVAVRPAGLAVARRAAIPSRNSSCNRGRRRRCTRGRYSNTVHLPSSRLRKNAFPVPFSGGKLLILRSREGHFRRFRTLFPQPASTLPRCGQLYSTPPSAARRTLVCRL